MLSKLPQFGTEPNWLDHCLSIQAKLKSARESLADLLSFRWLEFLCEADLARSTW